MVQTPRSRGAQALLPRHPLPPPARVSRTSASRESAKALGRLRALVEEAERIAAQGHADARPGRRASSTRSPRTGRASRRRWTTISIRPRPWACSSTWRGCSRARARRSKRAGSRPGGFLVGVGELVTLARVLGLLEPGGRAERPVDPQLKARIESLLYLREAGAQAARLRRGRPAARRADRARRHAQGLARRHHWTISDHERAGSRGHSALRAQPGARAAARPEPPRRGDRRSSPRAADPRSRTSSAWPGALASRSPTGPATS